MGALVCIRGVTLAACMAKKICCGRPRYMGIRIETWGTTYAFPRISHSLWYGGKNIDKGTNCNVAAEFGASFRVYMTIWGGCLSELPNIRLYTDNKRLCMKIREPVPGCWKMRVLINVWLCTQVWYKISA